VEVVHTALWQNKVFPEEHLVLKHFPRGVCHTGHHLSVLVCVC